MGDTTNNIENSLYGTLGCGWGSREHQAFLVERHS
jgi:hypothetical protein